MLNDVYVSHREGGDVMLNYVCVSSREEGV